MAEARELTMALVGDVRVARAEPLTAFRHVRSILRDAEFTLGNLEGSMSDGGTPWAKHGVGANWKSDARQTVALEHAGFNAMSVANNHAMDFGSDALLETIGHLDRLGIAHAGGGRNFTEAHAPAIVERAGCRVALLGYTALYARGWEAGSESPGLAVIRGGTAYEPHPKFFEGPGRPPIIRSWILPEDKAQIAADIAVARQQADLVICTFHWGISGQYIKLTEYQPDVGHHAIDAGADLVFGHHPHVLQGIEVYRGRPIFYSLGNFVFDAKKRYDPQKMLVRCRIQNRKITAVEFLPVLDSEKTPRVVSLSEGKEVVDLVAARSAEFGTKFEPAGDAIRVLTNVS